MKSTILWALVVLNALLLASFLARVTRDNTAMAQQNANQPTRRPGDYLMIPGEVPGGNTALVYVVDTVNGYLGAIAYDDTRNTIDVMPRIDLNRAFEAALQRQTPTPAPGNNPPGRGAGRGNR